MKKIILASALMVAGLSFVACDSDDNTGSQNPMVGTWEATELSYFRPDLGEDSSHPFSAIKGDCNVDILTINEDNSAILDVEEGDNCEEDLLNGEWNDETVTIAGEEAPRSVISIEGNELKLKYKANYSNFPPADITVTYIRK